MYFILFRKSAAETPITGGSWLDWISNIPTDICTGQCGIGPQNTSSICPSAGLYRMMTSSIVTIGGGAVRTFSQIKADVRVDIMVFETGETALLGSAVIAACGVGMLSDYKQPIRRVMKKRAEYLSDAEKHRAYSFYADAYLKAIDQVTPFYNSVAQKGSSAQSQIG